MAGRADIKAGAAYVELYVRNSAFNKGLKNAQAKLHEFGSGLMAIGVGFMAAGGAIVGSLAAATSDFLAFGDSLDKMRQRTGISVESLSELAHAAGQSGTSIDAVEKAVRKMQQEVGKAGTVSAEVTDTLDSLGVSLDDIRSLTPEKQFELLASKIGDIEDPTQRAAAAVALFGRGGTAMLPMIEDMEALRQEARDLGFTLSGEAAADAVKLGDMLANLGKTFLFVGRAVAESLAKPLMAIVASIQRVSTQMLKWIQANQSVVIAVAKVGAVLFGVGAVIAAVGLGITGLGAAFGLASFAIGGFASAVGAVSSVLGLIGATFAVVFSPIGLLVGLLASAGVALLAFTDSGRSVVSWFTSRFVTIAKHVRETVGGIFDAIQKGDLAGAAKVAMKGVRTAIDAAIGEIASLWAKVVNAASAAWAFIVGVASSTWASIVSVVESAMSILPESMRRIGGDIWARLIESAKGIVSPIMATFGRVIDGVREAFNRIVTVAGDAFRGIVDAIRGGDFALAGRIAITGLQLALTEGFVAIGNAIGGIWGDIVKSIGGKLAGGDFVGAWNDALLAMSAVWDAWSEGVVKTFTGMASAIINVWQTATSAISKMILEQQGKLRKLLDASDFLNPVAMVSGVSTADRILGSDITAEQQRSDELQNKLDESNRRNLTGIRDDLTQEINLADVLGDEEQSNKLRERLAEIDRQIANIGSEQPDLLGGAIADAERQIASTADAIQAKLDEIERTAEAKTAAGFESLGDAAAAGVSEAESEIERLRADLERLKGEAKSKREAADAEPVAPKGVDEPPGADPEAAAKASAPAPVAVTSSAAGLIALGQGQGGGVQQQTLAEMKAMRKATEESRKSAAQWIIQAEKMIRKLDNLGLGTT